MSKEEHRTSNFPSLLPSPRKKLHSSEKRTVNSLTDLKGYINSNSLNKNHNGLLKRSSSTNIIKFQHGHNQSISSYQIKEDTSQNDLKIFSKQITNFQKFNRIILSQTVSKNKELAKNSQRISLPSLTTSIDSGKFGEGFSAMQKNIPLHKKVNSVLSEDSLFLGRLSNFKSSVQEKIQKSQSPSAHQSIDQKTKQEKNALHNISTVSLNHSKKASLARSDASEATDNSMFPININDLQNFIKNNQFSKDPSNGNIMNIVNNVNPKSTDKKVEINFNQYEIKIVPKKKDTIKNNTPVEQIINDDISQEKLNIQMPSSPGEKNQRSLRIPKQDFVRTQSLSKNSSPEIVINKGGSNKIVVKLDKSGVNINNNQDNISISIGGNGERKEGKEKENEKEKQRKENDSESNKKKVLGRKIILSKMEIIKSREQSPEKDISHQKEKRTEINSQLSKISENSNKQTEKNDSISLERQSNKCGTNTDTLQKKLAKSKTFEEQINPIFLNNDIRRKNRAVTFKYTRNENNLNRTLALGYSIESQNSLSTSYKRNNTYNEEGNNTLMKESSQICSESEKEEKEKLRVMMTPEMKIDAIVSPLIKKRLLLSVNSMQGCKFRKHSDTSFQEDIGNFFDSRENHYKLAKFEDSVKNTVGRINDECMNIKIEFLDVAINKIILFIEQGESMYKQAKKVISNEKKDEDNNILGGINKDDSTFLFGLAVTPRVRIKENVYLDTSYNKFLLLKYFDLSIPHKIFVERNLRYDIDLEFLNLITLMDNFYCDDDESVHDEFHNKIKKKGFLLKKTNKKKALRQLSLLKQCKTGIPLNDFPKCFALGKDDFEYLNKYLFLDMINPDGTSKLSSINNGYHWEDNMKIDLKPTVQFNTKNEQDERNSGINECNSSEKEEMPRCRVSSRLSGTLKNLGLKTRLVSLMTSPIKRASMKVSKGYNDSSYSFKKTLPIGMKPNENNVSFESKRASFFVPGIGFLCDLVDDCSKNKIFPQSFSLLNKKKFFSRIRDDATNFEFGKLNEKLNEQRIMLFKRRSTLFSPLHQRKTLKKKEEEDEKISSETRKMNKESMLFRTHEIKSQILTKLEGDKASLFFMIKDGNFQRFKEIMDGHKISPELQDNEGNSCLNLAVQCNSFEITEYLLSIGADVNTQNKKHNTPLHYALTYKNFRITDLLIQRGADESRMNKAGLTPWQCLMNSESIV